MTDRGRRRSPSRVAAIIVGYAEPLEDVSAAVASLVAQEPAPHEIVYVDQRVDGGAHAARLIERHREVRRVDARSNLGYAAASELGARAAESEFLFFLTPDATAQPGCLRELADALSAEPGRAIAGAQVLLPGGTQVNAGDNVLHITGLAWSGRWGEAPESGPPREAVAPSGAALMVRRRAFEALDGYTDGFFMYYDDVDLAWRARLAGWSVVFCPRARVEHDYEFEKGAYKWHLLERNRWWCLLAHLERRTLVLLAPLLVALEVAILAAALRGGFFHAKTSAWRSLWRSRGALRERRREVQRARVVGDARIVTMMAATLDSPVFPAAASRLAAPLLARYRAVILGATG